eukprot:91388-Chlamydomonas_euryale.AAC.1
MVICTHVPPTHSHVFVGALVEELVLGAAYAAHRNAGQRNLLWNVDDHVDARHLNHLQVG